MEASGAAGAAAAVDGVDAAGAGRAGAGVATGAAWAGCLRTAANHFCIFCIRVIHDVITMHDIGTAFYPGLGIQLDFIHTPIVFNTLRATFHIFVFTFHLLLESGWIA